MGWRVEHHFRGVSSSCEVVLEEMADKYVHLIRLAYLLCGYWSAAEDPVAEAYARARTPWSGGTVEELPAGQLLPH